MTTGLFRQRIRQSLADENLQAALDANAARRQAGRLIALAALPDYQERRARAHAIKADVIAHLDRYLEQFIKRAEANGIIVHRAANADQAVRIVLETIEQHKAKNKTLRPSASSADTPLSASPANPFTIAKSKSMVSEEIELNHALEAHGYRVVETDLGEYIVQLRGERPSHIITPAVHLRRSDVGRLFEEKLGLPYTEDIPTLTNAARRTLRQVFLSAKVGISGVNFGVVESGTLVLVTNEGNGRMVTTLPPVHIALMGIERLVPSLDDLALFLSLLPRSATGQKLSVYTSFINAPLPGQSRHLILLDNGRSILRASPLAESLYCIRCGACLNACPVFREAGGHAYGSIYPGPIGSVISAALVNPEFDYLAQASSLCGACREACPVDIDLPGLLLRVRAGETGRAQGKKPAEGRGLPALVKLGLKGFGLVASTPRLFAVFQTLGGILSRLLSPRRAYMRLPAWTGWGYSKDFPRLAITPFRARWKHIQQTLGQPLPLAQEQFLQATPIEQPLPAHQEPQPLQAVPEKLPSQPIPQNIHLVERFVHELTALGVTVERLSEADLISRLQAFLAEKGAVRVLSDQLAAPYLGPAAVLDADASLQVGVTGALCAIAETGSIILTGQYANSLAASLLPPTHAVLLRADQIVETLAQALARPEVRTTAAGVIITGPSRTADIEMSLTIGVHGPGEVHIFLIEESQRG
ncbi:MAG: LUD domain-containing protein [Anaerolineales bacterium]|nr:LUD domain-containing protein [Anaerolineales bacterium]MCX7607756.1 LUD domain-containing protein [Anaerolineales bacterium]MDW8226329.1 LUD domain-containing protein [Anaerolineales bacterium]